MSQSKQFCHERKIHHVSVVTVSVVTILVNFELISKMLVTAWLARTVLNGCTHIKAQFYARRTKKACLVAENWCLVFVTLLIFKLFNTFASKWWDLLYLLNMQPWGRGTQVWFLIKNVWIQLKSFSVHGLKLVLFW